MIRISCLWIIFFALLYGCKQPAEIQYDVEELLNAYVDVWNTGDFEPLDTIVSQEFELRINPDFKPVIGIDSLKQSIEATRSPFKNFAIHLKERTSISPNVCLITWEIISVKNRDGGKMEIDGFSVIFHANGKITGEWISYSDLNWAKGLGYEVIPPE